jgi:kynurenine formamidase
MGETLVDMTLPFEEGMQAVPGLSGFEAERSVAEDTGAVTHRYTSTTHLGTHVDAPAHFVDGPTIDELPLDRWRGAARVVDLRNHCGETITASILETRAGNVDAGDRVLLLTGDVDERFGSTDFFDRAAVLSPDAAEWLVDREIALLANDFLTEPFENPERPVHHTLLGAGTPIVEYLCNADAVADATDVEFSCFPLNIPGFEASPVRAVTRR